MGKASDLWKNLKKDNTKLATLAVFVFDIVVLIVVLIMLWAMPEPKTPGENCGYMCLPCKTTPNGICCGCRANRFSEYLKESFNESYNKADKDNRVQYDQRVSQARIYGGYIGDVKPVAHMIGERREPTDTSWTGLHFLCLLEDTLPVTKWYKGNNCLLLNGVSIYNGRLRVPVKGFYHVYSMLDISYQIEKDSSDKSVIPSESSVLVHSIFRSNIETGSDEMILSTYHPYVFSKNEHFGRFDTFISSDIYLNAGDEVYVKVSNISQVNSPPKNTIGIYMI